MAMKSRTSSVILFVMKPSIASVMTEHVSHATGPWRSLVNSVYFYILPIPYSSSLTMFKRIYPGLTVISTETSDSKVKADMQLNNTTKIDVTFSGSIINFQIIIIYFLKNLI